MHRSSLSALPLLALALIHCNNPMLIVDVDIDYWPTEARQILLVTTLNGQPGKEQRLSIDERRLAVHLPADASGTVAVRVYGIDAVECIWAEGKLEAPVPSNLNRTEQHRIKLTRPSEKQCSFAALGTGISPLPSFTAVWGSDPNNMFIVGGGADGGSYKNVVIRCGSTSTECTPIDSRLAVNSASTNRAVWGSDPNRVFVVDGQGRVLHCSAEAATCKEIYNAVTTDFKVLWGSGPENIYAGGNSQIQRIHRCSASTNTCSPMTSSASLVSSIWGSSSEYVYAVDSNRMVPAVVRCRASSTTCDQLTSSKNPALPYLAVEQVWGSDPLNVYAVGAGGTIVRCTASTSVCTPLNSGTTAQLKAVWGSDPENVYAVGDKTIVRCQAGTDTCLPLNHGTTSTFKAVWGSDARNVYAVGSGGVVVRCAAGESTCTPLTSGTSNSLNAVFGTDSNNLYLVGDGIILRRRL